MRGPVVFGDGGRGDRGFPSVGQRGTIRTIRKPCLACAELWGCRVFRESSLGVRVVCVCEMVEPSWRVDMSGYHKSKFYFQISGSCVVLLSLSERARSRVNDVRDWFWHVLLPNDKTAPSLSELSVYFGQGRPVVLG